MAAITLSNPVYYSGGASGATAIIGVDGTNNRVVRFTLTSPATGASSVSLSITGLQFGMGTIPTTLRFYIGTEAESHKNAGASSTYTGTLNIDTSTNTSFSGTADFLLLPNKTYYLFIFPSTTTGGWFYASAATFSLNGLGGAGLVYIDNGSGWDAHQVYIDNGTSWDLHMLYIDNGTSWDLYT